MSDVPRFSPTRPLTLGIVTDEHLGLAESRKGGFGWASQQVGRFFLEHPELGVNPVVLNCERTHGRAMPAEIEGVPAIWRRGGRLATFDRKGRRFDLLLFIDYRPNYRIAFLQWPRTTAIVWVRDPWGPDEHADLRSLRLPGQPEVQPQGVIPPDHRSMRQMWQLSRWTRRKLLLGTTASFLRRRVPGAYDLPTSIEVPILPNLLTLRGDDVPKSARPSALFLARMDPVKRPWLFIELARDFPEVDFVVAGKNHFTGAGSWQPENIPANVKFLGHIDGEEKRRAIASAWVLINTSIHEGLPVSVQEALACGVPLLSTLDPEETASRFGIFVGKHGGDGAEALPALRAGLKRLLENHEERRRLGEAGRAWVTAVHNPAAFFASFRELCRHAGRPLEVTALASENEAASALART
jgi:glycosyltransferase involved in cell wall biosynthesis